MIASEWTAISGSWRVRTPQLTDDLCVAVRRELALGRGIVTGGALGVDYEATDQTLALYPAGERLLVIIQTALDIYDAHYERRAREGVISAEQYLALIAQLRQVRALGALVELDGAVVDQSSYYHRNTEVLRSASRLLAFQVNDSAGTGDTIDKARAQGLEIEAFSYRVLPESAGSLGAPKNSPISACSSRILIPQSSHWASSGTLCVR